MKASKSENLPIGRLFDRCLKTDNFTRYLLGFLSLIFLSPRIPTGNFVHAAAAFHRD